MNYFVRKISTKQIRESESDSAVVAGIATRSETIETQYGPCSRFHGSFALKVGNKEYRSAKLFLPAIAEEMLNQQLVDAGTDARIAFAFNIRAEDDPSSNVGYTWVVEPLLEPEAESDPLTQLLAEVTEVVSTNEAVASSKEMVASAKQAVAKKEASKVTVSKGMPPKKAPKGSK